MRFVLCVLGVAVLVFSGRSAAETPVLVKDIRAGSLTSNPIQLTDVNGTLFFTADDSAHGQELWKSDGTAAGTVLVKDINPSGDGIALGQFANVNGMLFFEASDGSSGLELWKSDGTVAGTVLVKDINGGPGNSYPNSLTDMNGTLFFVAADVNGYQLWKSDGTVAGTVLVKDINPLGASSPDGLTNVNGTLFFEAYEGTDGGELWKSDGTAAGTVLVKDIRAGSGSAALSSLTDVNGMLFFVADDGTNGRELWKSDGTALGTVLVKNIGAGSGSASPSSLTDVNGTLLFTADNGTDGRELWKSDGTAAGTVLVKDIRAGAGSSPDELTTMNGTLFFQASDGTNGRELWKTDGTAAGTVLVKDIYAGSLSSDPLYLTNVNGRLFFSAMSSGTVTELWTSDGTEAGTVLIADICAGGCGSFPQLFTLSCPQLFFTADNGLVGQELWSLHVLDSSCSGPTGLAGLWKGEGNANDAASCTHGTPRNGATFIGGKVGQCFRLDGVDDHVDDLGNATTFAFVQNTGIFSIEAWIELDDPNALRAQTIAASINVATQKGFYFGVINNAGQHQLQMALGNGSGSLVIDARTPMGVLTDANWHHVAATGDGTNVTLYVDGVAYPPAAMTGTKSTGNASLPVGLGWDGFGSYFGGQLDELAMYDRALLASEVQAIYTAGAAGRCGLAVPPSTLSSRWSSTGGHYPEASCPWVLFDTADPEAPGLSNNVLTLSTSDLPEYLYYEQTDYLRVPDTLKIQARFRVVSESHLAGYAFRGAGIEFAVAPDSANFLFVGRDTVFLWSAFAQQGPTAFVDTDGAFHTYEIRVIHRSAITVYQDGAQILTGSIVGSNGIITQPTIAWGDMTSGGVAVSEWVSFVHNANTIVCGEALAVPPDAWAATTQGPGISLIPYPNPAYGRVAFVIGATVDRGGPAWVRIYDVTGRRVKSLSVGRVTRGLSRLEWDGTDDRGRVVSSGTYLLRLEIAGKPSGSVRATIVR